MASPSAIPLPVDRDTSTVGLPDADDAESDITAGGVLLGSQQACEVCGVACGGSRRLRHRLGYLVEIVVVGGVHRFAVPVRVRLGREREADVVEPLGAVGEDLCAHRSSLPTTEMRATLPYMIGRPSSIGIVTVRRQDVRARVGAEDTVSDLGPLVTSPISASTPSAIA